MGPELYPPAMCVLSDTPRHLIGHEKSMFRQLGYVLIIQAAVNVKGEKLVPPEANILSSKGFRQG